MRLPARVLRSMTCLSLTREITVTRRRSVGTTPTPALPSFSYRVRSQCFRQSLPSADVAQVTRPAGYSTAEMSGSRWISSVRHAIPFVRRSDRYIYNKQLIAHSLEARQKPCLGQSLETQRIPNFLPIMTDFNKANISLSRGGLFHTEDDPCCSHDQGVSIRSMAISDPQSL